MPLRARRSAAADLRNENPNTTSPEAARVWASAYRELVDFESQVLSEIKNRLPTLSTVARRETENSNIPMVTQQLQTFQYRLAFWLQRVAELDGV